VIAALLARASTVRSAHELTGALPATWAATQVVSW
jgi:hypothetical protein